MAENFDLIFGSSASQSYSWNDSDYQNGWQTVGDTPPTREQFDALQRRADLKAQELNNRLAPIEENDTHDYRQPSTAYTARQIAYHPSLPTGWYLECTTAGDTDAGELVITSPSVGDTVTDGTVVWMVDKAFPATGGILYGNNIHRSVNDSSFSLYGGTGHNTGARLFLWGGDSSQRAGEFAVEVVDTTNSVVQSLSAYKDGRLYWAGNNLAGSAIVAKSLGTNGYVKYASGLIVQWGELDGNWPADSSHTATYPVSFTSNPRVFLTGHASTGYPVYKITSRSVTGFSFTFSPASNGVISWFAVGY